MIQKLKSKLLVLSAFLALAVPFAVPALATAQCTPGTTGGNDCIQGGLCNGAQTLQVTPGTQQCSEQDNGLQGIIQTVVNILSIIVGVVAVIMIIVGGFRYITSGGKAERITGAKNTILYALIGLIIVALAQVIVRFVLTKVTT
jgi:hypothetical protein